MEKSASWFLHRQACITAKPGASHTAGEPTFIDVLHACPRLLQLLPDQCLSPLAATARQTRHLVHAHVTMVTVRDKQDIHSLVKGFWPQLRVITISFQSGHPHPMLGVLATKWHLLACVQMSTSLRHFEHFTRLCCSFTPSKGRQRMLSASPMRCSISMIHYFQGQHSHSASALSSQKM